MAGLGPKRTNLRFARVEKPSLRPDLRPDLKSKRPNLRPQRSNFFSSGPKGDEVQ